MQDRIDTLEQISKLPVSIYKDKGTYFVFGESDKPLKTTCTYPKAKLFAEGVALGRKLADKAVQEKLVEMEKYLQGRKVEIKKLKKFEN